MLTGVLEHEKVLPPADQAALFKACGDGDHARVGKLLGQRQQGKKRGGAGTKNGLPSWECLIAACIAASPACVRALLDWGCPTSGKLREDQQRSAIEVGLKVFADSGVCARHDVAAGGGKAARYPADPPPSRTAVAASQRAHTQVPNPCARAHPSACPALPAVCRKRREESARP